MWKLWVVEKISAMTIDNLRLSHSLHSDWSDPTEAIRNFIEKTSKCCQKLIRHFTDQGQR